MPAPGQTKLTPERREKFLQALRAGMTRAAAAGVIRVDKSQITRWCQRSATFATECEVAEQEFEASLAAVVLKAAKTDPKMALEVLKRRRKDEWGDRQNVTVLLERAAKEVLALDDADLLKLLDYGTDPPDPPAAG